MKIYNILVKLSVLDRIMITDINIINVFLKNSVSHFYFYI